MNEIDLSAEANRLPTIKFRDYDNSVKEFDPRYVLPFDTNNLPFESQATTYFQIAQLTEQANFAWKNAKVELDGVRSSLYTYYLRNLSKDTKKPTENNISAHIMQDKRYTDAFNKTNLMERNYRILVQFTNAMSQRKDMLQSMSASKRAELQSGQNTSVVDKQTGQLYNQGQQQQQPTFKSNPQGYGQQM